MQEITFVGLDVDKATIAVSVAAGGRDGEVRHLGRVEIVLQDYISAVEDAAALSPRPAITTPGGS